MTENRRTVSRGFATSKNNSYEVRKEGGKWERTWLKDSSSQLNLCYTWRRNPSETMSIIVVQAGLDRYHFLTIEGTVADGDEMLRHDTVEHQGESCWTVSAARYIDNHQAHTCWHTLSREPSWAPQAPLLHILILKTVEGALPTSSTVRWLSCWLTARNCTQLP